MLGPKRRGETCKTSKVGLDWYEFVCFESIATLFGSQHNLLRTI